MNKELNEQFWNLVDSADEAFTKDDIETYSKLITKAEEIRKQLVDTSCKDEYTTTEADIAFNYSKPNMSLQNSLTVIYLGFSLVNLLPSLNDLCAASL